MSISSRSPDFGTAALSVAVGLTLLFLAGARWRYILPTAAGIALLFAVAVIHNRAVRTGFTVRKSVLEELGRNHGVGAATMAYAWILRHPAQPLPITGSGRIEALRDAVSALDAQLSTEDWYRVWQASAGHEVP